ncbi:PREDICTED: membrane-spanning 4-domains subfamily A member 4A-like [Gekko japonicus]|uniref:Membrane-spanning 4-domains subfamily A member 4A-like n=1 Tax=Gekko japonicus TaxID=146911 RepID=A0ABM1K9J3_GEKJA|nr:PREDICTED: membrane-spanning 4-domains subfamily A member 4A-like [Gekko japonicus]
MDLNNPATLESISNSIIRPSVSRPLKNLYRGEPMALGITQIGIGIVVIAFGLVIVMAEGTLEYHYGEIHIRTPYWTGILYIISGSLSVVVAKKPEISLVKGMLGMNVVSAVAAGIAIVILSISVAHISYYSECDGYYNTEMPPEICHEVITIPYTQMRYMAAVLLTFTILEFLITIITAAFGCAGLCRNSYSETTVVIFQNTARGTPPAVLTPVKEDEAP